MWFDFRCPRRAEGLIWDAVTPTKIVNPSKDFWLIQVNLRSDATGYDVSTKGAP